MESILFILSGLLSLSLGVNALLGYKSFQNKKNQKLTYDARQLLHDLTSQVGIVEIRRIDPESILLRSPR